MATVTLNEVLELTRKLPVEEQEKLMDLVRRERIERWRQEVAEEGEEAKKDFLAGKLKAEPAEAIIARLEADWAKEDQAK